MRLLFYKTSFFQIYIILLYTVFSIQVVAQDSVVLKKRDSILKLIEQTNSIDLKISHYKAYGNLITRKEKRKYLNYLLISRDLYAQKNDLKEYCDYTQYIGWFYTVKMEAPDSAEVFLDEGLKLAKQLNDTLLIGKGLTYKGLMYQRKGFYKLAMTHLLESLPYKNALGELNRIAFSYNLIGEVYNTQKQYDKGLNYHFKALELRKKLGSNEFHIANSYVNISKGYYGDKKYNRALDYALKALEIYKEIGTGHNISKSHNLVGNAYLRLDEVDKAITNYEESLKIHPKIKIKFLKIEALDGLAESYFKNGELNKSEKYALEGLKLAKAHKYADIKQNSYFILFEIEKSKKNYQKALSYYEKYIKAKDSLVNEKTTVQISEMERLYNIEKKENEIATLATKHSKQLQLTKKKSYERNIAVIITFIVVTLGALLYYFYKKTHQKKKELELALSDRNILLKETHHRIKNSFQMVSSLLFLQSENIEDEKVALAVKDGQNRVKSMALIHQKLYQNDNLVGIHVKEYFEELIKDIFMSYNINQNDIELRTRIDDFVLDVDSIIPLGLIVNELITNALKHAYSIHITNSFLSIDLFKKENFLLFTVQDNGVGFDKEKVIKTSFGLKLITSLTKKINGELEYHQDNGTRVVLKIFKYKIV